MNNKLQQKLAVIDRKLQLLATVVGMPVCAKYAELMVKMAEDLEKELQEVDKLT